MAPAALPTVPAVQAEQLTRRARLIRRLYLGLIAVFLSLGLAGVYGSRTATVTATANGYTLRVIYPKVTRSSLPIKWQLLVTHPGGFTGSVTVAVPIDYFNLFDFNNFYPLPDSTVNQGGTMIMVFSAPVGDTLDVLLDARTQAGLRAGQRTSTAVLAGDGQPLVAVRYGTRVLP